ncbi:MAG: hypothetical protein J6K58_05705 [Lachnospiraceae bacterium]|nr:hypothetical protein [Lachnospiraceae bacterium]
MDIRETIRSLFAYEEMGIRRFSKDTYAPSFEKFQEIAGDFDQELNRLYEVSCGEGTDEMEAAESQGDLEAFCAGIARDFVDFIKENEEQGISRAEQEERQRSHNMFMATYVLPHILEMRNPYYKELAKSIEKAWGTAFKNSKIKGAAFETVAGGFQKKFLGFSL